MTLAYLRLLGQVGPIYPDPASQRETLMFLVVLAAIGMVCLLATAVKTRKLKMVLAVGGGVFAVLIVVSVIANLSMLFIRPQPVVNLTGSQQHAVLVPADSVETESYRTSVSSKAIVESDGQASSAEAEALPQRQQLFSDLVDTWQADVYPSDRAAVRALLARIDKQIDSMTAEQKEPAEIQVQGKVRHELLVQVVDALKKTHSESRITFAQTPEESVMAPADKQTVIVHVLSNQGGKGITPYIRMQAVGWEHSRTEQANFVNKSWVDDYAAFANENNSGTYVAAVSQQPATSAEESQRNAMVVAAESLKHRVSAQMDPRIRGMLWRRSDAERWLVERIAAELQNSRIVADRFVQRLEAPYGEVWQTSLLVDASPKNIASLAGKCDRLMALQERGTRRTALSVAGVIALVCLVYAGLNAVTRGYFAWSLRAMALAMMAGGVFLILLFRG